MQASHLARTVLVVDDDEAIRSLIVRLLVRRGYLVLQAADGAVALERMNDGHGVDLVITDLEMPHVSGLELMAHLRERGCRSRFLLCCGTPQLVDCPSLLKPFSLVELHTAVEQALAG